jgi:hypothetical protein
MKELALAVCLILSSCTLFKKSGDDEMEKMTQDVLKAKEGVDIQIKPIPKDKK